MPGIVRADTWKNLQGETFSRVINSVSYKWQDAFTTTSLSYVDVTGSSFSYTPIRSNSRLMIRGQVSMSPINTSVQYTGQNYAIFVNGIEQGKQLAAHEVYVYVGATAGADIYIGPTIKTAFYNVSNTNALTINIRTRVYNVTTTTGRINQGSNWESYIHVWEIAQ